MKNTSWTIEENEIIKRLYPENKVSEIKNLTGRSLEGIKNRAIRMNLKINISSYRHREKTGKKRISNQIRAEIIEAYVCNPNVHPNELGVTRSFFIECISLWFKYKGDNSIVLVLESKV